MKDTAKIDEQMEYLAKKYLVTEVSVYDGKKHPKKKVGIDELNRLAKQIRGSLVYDW